MGPFLVTAGLLLMASSGARLRERSRGLCSLGSLLVVSLGTVRMDLLRLRDSFSSEGCTRPLGSRDSARRPLDLSCSDGGRDTDLDLSAALDVRSLDL